MWSSTPCISFRKDVLGRHAKSDQHKSAVELESYGIAAERDGEIAQAFQSQVSLQHTELKLKRPADTRWLLHDSACQTLVKVFPAVCASLSREAEERGYALAVGLHNVVRKYSFVASLYMMCNILPTVTRLSCALQASCIDVSQLHLLVISTIEALELLCTSKGTKVKHPGL